MNMTPLIALVEAIERAMDEYTAGWRNDDALRIISRAIQDIRFQSDRMEGYCALDGNRELLFDHGYVREKLSALTGEADRLYSLRKQAIAGGIDEVKRQAMGDCSRLSTYFRKPWLKRLAGDRDARAV